MIVKLIKSYSSQARPLIRHDLADAVEIIVQGMPACRREKVPFIGNRTGKKFRRNFEMRHKTDIKLGMASRQEVLVSRNKRKFVIVPQMQTIWRPILQRSRL